MDVDAAAKIYSQGVKLKQQGKIEEAISCYRQAIELHPNYYQYYYQLANILREQGQLVQAKLYYRQAIELNPDDSWCYYSLGEILAQQNEWEAAVDCYRKAIALNPDFSWSHYNLGRILQQHNRLDDAINCYRRAIELDSEYSWSHHFLAEILTQKGKFEEAVFYYQQAIKLNPNFYRSHFNLGRNYQILGRDKAAIDCYFKAIELNPDRFWSCYYLGEIFANILEIERAIGYFQQAIELNPQYPQTYFCLGQILLESDSWAVENYRNSIKTRSKLWQAYFEIGLGQAWEKQRNFAAAIDCYLNAIKIDPNLQLPYKILQYVEIPPEKLDEIIIFYQQLTEKNPNLDLAWGNLGDVLTQANKIDDAIICYRHSCYHNAINLNPELAKFDWAIAKQKAPDFIIIGAPKCGTSSLYVYLQQHPRVLLSHKKEINFFNKHFDRGIDWYLAHFPAITDAENFITGEASTQYIFTQEAERKIVDAFPDTKIIIMLRDPVERTISDYYHHLNRGLETRSLKTIVETSLQQLNKLQELGSKYKIGEFDYILKSVYFYQICFWRKIINQDNILIVNSNTFFEDTQTEMERVWQFLQLDCYSSSNYMKYNVGAYLPVANEIKQQLAQLFQPYNQKLESYLGVNFNWSKYL